MTILSLLARFDHVLIHTFDTGIMTEWLEELDWKVKKQLIDTHEGAESVEFNGYDAKQSISSELLIPDAYVEVYLRWLEAKIHFHNGENDRYNDSMALFNAAWKNFENWYNRTHMPLTKRHIYF